MFDLKMRHRPFSMMEYNALKNNIIIMWAMCCFRTETTECIAQQNKVNIGIYRFSCQCPFNAIRNVYVRCY